MFKKLKLILVILTMIQLGESCGEGCLKCSTEELCELCDFVNAYVLKEGKCVQSAQENCVLYNLEGKCMTCEPGFFLQELNRKCLPVESFNLVENCLHYSNQGQCLVCQPEFYLQANKCIGIENKISNCLYYEDEKRCKQCEEGYLLSLSQKNCVLQKEVGNCLAYSLHQCTQCNEQSIREPSIWNRRIEDIAKEFSLANKSFVFDYFSSSNRYYHEFCVITQVPNCAVFEDYRTCSKCQTGYYLEENKCLRNPSNFIPNCLRYASLNECIECAQGFFLQDSVTCQPVETFEHCVSYQTKAATSLCQQCSEDRFLETPTTCTLRTKLTIENCSQLDYSADRCKVCANSYRITADFLKCLPDIDNCISFDQNTSETTEQHTCQQCANGHYLEANACVLGTVENCEVYESTQNVCKICKNKYFLKDLLCVLHPDVSNCSNYDNLVERKCNTCKVGAEKFIKKTFCRQVNRIANCATYSDVDTCQICELGHNLKENQCLQIPSDLNCSYMINDVCQSCKLGFFLKDGQCKAPLRVSLEGCARNGDIDSNGYQHCASCAENYIPYSHLDNQFCMTTPEQLLQFSETSAVIENCEMYIDQGTNLECLRCRPNFYLKEDGTSCLSTCITTVRRLVLQLTGDRVVNIRRNVCATSATSNCDVLTSSVNNGVHSEECLKCKAGFDKIIDLTETKELHVFPEDVVHQNKTESIFKELKTICENQNQTPRRPSPQQVSMFQGCKYWYKFGILGEKGCLACANNYKGLVKNWEVNNCREYDQANQKCLKCMNKYAISASGYECQLITAIPNCRWYKENVSVCEICETGFYLHVDGSGATTCAPINPMVKGCEKYDLLTSKCLECSKGLHLYKNLSNIQFCIKTISRCEDYRNITSSEDMITCIQCEDGYYPDAQEGCIKGTVPHCWQYEQVSAQNVCKKYINYIPFLQKNKCQSVTPIQGCLTYKSQLNNSGVWEIVCDKCDSKSHYQSGDLCCPYGFYNSNGKCTQILVNDCKKSTSPLKCDVCSDNYYFDKYMNELEVPYKCCGEQTYWNPNTSMCDPRIDVSLNTRHCIIYNIENNLYKCKECRNGYYISDEYGYCCPLGQKHKFTWESGHQCVNIEKLKCNKVSCTGAIGAETCQCTECISDHTLDATDKICCSDLEQYYDSVSKTCKALPHGCKTYDAANSKCTECKSKYDTYEKDNADATKKVCCDSSVSPPEWYRIHSTQQDCTVKGGTSADSVSFVYPVDDCILTDFNVTDHGTDITQASCLKCKTGLYPSGYKNRNCCPEGKMWNGTVQACLGSEFFQDCARINISLTSSTSPFCLSCRKNYYLNNGVCVKEGKTFQTISGTPTTYEIQDIVLSNCLKIGDSQNNVDEAATICSKCKEGYSVSNNRCVNDMEVTVGGKVYLLDELAKNCGVWDTASNLCQVCHGLAFKQDGNLCCTPSQKIENNKCVDVTDQTELTTLQKTRQPIVNCEEHNDDSTCSKCLRNFILVDNECKSVLDSQKQCDANHINEHCSSTTLTNLNSCVCDTCQYWAYKSDGKCCPYGTYWSSSLNRCVRIEDPNCATSDGSACTECFFDSSNKLVVSNMSWKAVKSEKTIIGLGSPIEKLYDQKLSTHFLTEGICCPKKTYALNGSCIPTTISNCEKAVYSNNKETCSECIMSKVPDSTDQTTCVDAADQSSFYSSNGVKVENGYFYDTYEEKIKPILDPNCKQSTSQYTCGTCKDNYELGNWVVRMRLDLFGNSFHDGLVEFKNVRVCHNKDTNLIFNHFQVRLFDQCIKYDSTNKKCQTCATGLYVTQGICCPLEQVAVLNQGIPFCMPINKVLENCIAFGVDTGVCLKCASGYTLSNGICCAEEANQNTLVYMDVYQKNNNCSLKPYNCYNYNELSQQCEICFYGKKNVSGKCLSPAKVLDATDSEVDTFNQVSNCVQVNELGHCETPNSGAYIFRNTACAFNYYKKEGATSCNTLIQELGSGFTNCTQLNDLLKCTNCKIGSYISNGHCCLIGEYFDEDNKKCIAIQKYKNCQEGFKNKEKDCQKCQEGHYLSAGFCVPQGKVTVDQIGTETEIQITGCIEAQDLNTCQKCTGDQVIYNNQCLNYVDISEDQRIGECLIIVGGTPPSCTTCKNGTYLNSNNCCQEGFYHNGQTCQTLETISLNCATWLNGKCQTCQVVDEEQTYLSNGLACCKNGFYAASATSCEPITALSNCQQTDTQMSCKLCSPGFKNNNGVCVINDIQNCSIGKDNSTCLICNQGFYFNKESQGCEPQPTIANCQKLKDNTAECELCNNLHYWDGYSCCQSTYYSQVLGVTPTNVQCVSMIPIEGSCLELSQGVCQSCGTNKLLTNNSCCNYGEFPVNNVCTPVTGTGLAKCKQFKSQTECKKLYDSDGNDASCFDNTYYTNGHCCSLGSYWTGTECSTNLTGNLLNCEKEGFSTCDKCKDGSYYSGGLCCETGKYTVNGVCATNTITNCDQQDGVMCKSCSTNVSPTTFGRCCDDQIFTRSTLACTAQPAAASGSPTALNPFNGKVVTCEGTNIPQAGASYCCPVGQLLVTGTCTDAATATSCKLFTSDSDNMNACVECETAGEYIVQKGATRQCLAIDDLATKKAFVEPGDTVVLALNARIDECEQRSDVQKCTACKTGKYLLENVCWSEGSLKNTDYVTAEQATSTNCKIPLSTDVAKCTLCVDNFVLDQTTELCVDGTGYVAPKQDCKVQDQSTPPKCQTCLDDFFLYTDSADTHTFCCATIAEVLNNGEVTHPFLPMTPDWTNGTCVPYMIEINNCVSFDSSSNKCKQCKNGFYMDETVGVCCTDGFWYDGTNTTYKCEQIPDAEKCLQKTTAGCIKCKVEENPLYISNGHCCNYETKWGGASCDALTNGCKTHDGTDCLTCIEGYNYFSTSKSCCPIGQYFNTTCVNTTITNCNLQKEASTTECDKCKTGYTKIKDTTNNDHCCLDSTFWNNTCLELKLVSQYNSNCLSFDRKNLECTRCDEANQYLNNGQCCNEGQYYNLRTQICTNITVPVNCLRYNNQGKCIKCAANHTLKTIDSTCVSDPITNCKTFNDTVTKCLECKTGFYLHREQCPPEQQETTSDTDANAKAMTVTNCLKAGIVDANTNNCESCVQTHYISGDKLHCCQLGTFWDASANQCSTNPSQFLNCNKFPDGDFNDCLECKPRYFLAVLKDGKKQCIKFSATDDECLVTTTGTENNKNTYTCSKCKNEGLDYILLPNTQTDTRYISFPAVLGCEKYDTTNLLSTSSLNCLKCSSNQINYLTSVNGIQKCKVRQSMIEAYSLEHCTSFAVDSDNCLSCVEGYHIFDVTATGGPFKRCKVNPGNCKIYDPSTSICKICKDNYVLIRRGTSPVCVENQSLSENPSLAPNFFPGYISQCVPNDECLEKYVGGLDGLLESLFSCHVCKQEGYIPFVSVRTDNDRIKGLQRYAKPLQNGDRQDISGGFYSSTCLRVSGETFGIQDDLFKFPSSCALGIINSNLPAISNSNFSTANKQQLGVYCSACKPGYKPKKSNIFAEYHHVYECELILNCEQQGENFNQCEKCQEGYLFEYVNSMIDRTACVEFTVDLNCEVFETISQEKKCKYCKQGFSFNYDGVCEKLQIENCSQDRLNLIPLEKRPLQSEVEVLMTKFSYGFGCQFCSNGQPGVVLADTNRKWFCTQSKYAELRKFISNSKFDSLCKTYKNLTSQLVCDTCLSTAVLTPAGKCIQLNDNLNNCVLAENAEVCKKCQIGYVLVDNKCIPQDIDNCLVYIENPTSNDIKCAECDDFFGLDNNVCVKDFFIPCKRINDKDECVQCQKGYHLAQIMEGQSTKTVCLPVFTHQDCLAYDSGEFNSKNLQCIQCDSNQFLLETLQQQEEVCNQIVSVRNCLSYHIQNTFTQSTLECESCASGYFLRNGECIPRNNTIPNCLSYESNSELCTACHQDFFLSEDKKTCIKNPRGVENCRVYAGETTCQECNQNYYVSQGVCKLVPTAQLVQSCRTYDENGQCSECFQGYLLKEQTCIAIQAKNCKTLTNEKECGECNFGFELKQQEDNVVSCVEIDKPAFQNCVTVSDTQPFSCLICSPHFYYDGEKCQEVQESKRIENCEVYESESSCKQCQKYHILSADKTLCVLEKNRNCERFEEQKEGFCVICGPGYELKEEQCVKVVSELPREENCLIWSQNAVENKIPCLICQPGFNMTTPGKCVENENTLDKKNPEPTDPTTPTDPIEGALTIKLTSILLFFLLNQF